MAAPSKILIADDHPMVRTALAHTLRATFGELNLVEAATQAALDQAIGDHPDLSLVLLDLCIPGARGFSSLLQLRATNPNLPVAVISAHDTPRNIQRARLYGASGFIPKTAALAQMQQALRTIHAGGQWFPELVEDADLARDADLAARLAELTPQQLRVLTCLADGLLNKQIAYELDLAENTVKVHVSAILRKLGAARRTQAALIARELAQAGEDLGDFD